MSDLFEFFKQQEAKLHEKPSEQVWKRLEKKLEQRKAAKRGRRIKPDIRIGLVALVLLVLLFAAVVLWIFVRMSN